MAYSQENELRIEALMDEMRALRWKRGKSGRVWAAKWGIGEDRVGHLAAEAWTRLKAEVDDTDRVKVTIGVALESMMSEARDNGDLKNAIAAAKTLADIVVGRPTERHDVTMRDGGPTPQDAARAVNAMFGKVTPQADPDARAMPVPSANAAEGEPQEST